MKHESQVRHAITDNGSLPRDIVRVLRSYMVSQLKIVAAVSVMCWISLALLGVRFAPVLGILTGSLSVIPVIGMPCAAVLAAIVASVDGNRFLPHAPQLAEGAVILGIYVLINTATDMMLAPYLMGKTLDMHPVLLAAVVIAGTALFGIPGSVLAVPAVLVVRTVVAHLRRRT